MVQVGSGEMCGPGCRVYMKAMTRLDLYPNDLTLETCTLEQLARQGCEIQRKDQLAIGDSNAYIARTFKLATQERL